MSLEHPIVAGLVSGSITYLVTRFIHESYLDSQKRRRVFYLLAMDVVSSLKLHRELSELMGRELEAAKRLKAGDVAAMSALLSGYVIAPPAFSAKEFVESLSPVNARLAAKWMERRLRLLEIERRYHAVFREVASSSEDLDAAKLSRLPWSEWCLQMEGHLEHVKQLSEEISLIGERILRAAQELRGPWESDEDQFFEEVDALLAAGTTKSPNAKGG